jgi:Ras-related protein Rab-21
MATEKFKVVLLGEGRVGKTSILLRYTKGEYSDRQVSTLQASYLDKKLTVGSQPIQLSIWDTAGQERFHALGPIYYRDASGALLVYDITDAESFHKVKNWVKELKKIVGNDIILVIAGNKVDLEKNRNVNEQEAVKYAESVGALHFHTSAKANRGLDDVFNALSQSEPIIYLQRDDMVLMLFYMMVLLCRDVGEENQHTWKSRNTSGRARYKAKIGHRRCP